MKFSTIFFDWGDTLSGSNGGEVPEEAWKPRMIKMLYEKSYRLGIISNTNCYQDAHWIRSCLEKVGCARYFECVISSAVYGYHKPDVRIFQKAVDFMEINPLKSVMVGDSRSCDGAAQILGMTYLPVDPGENWETRLWSTLDDSLHQTRKLTRVAEFGLNGDSVFIKMKNLSEALEVGDTLLLDQDEYVVIEIPFEFTKEDVAHRSVRGKHIELKVRPI
jgi:predicted HAD superfamily phosphohydrolase YqeG